MNAFARLRAFGRRVDLAWELWSLWGLRWADAWRIAGSEA